MWNESFYLYVSDPSSATLALTALDRDVFSEDDLLGAGSMAVADLRALSLAPESSGGTVTAVPVPLYMDAGAGGPLGLGLGWPFPARRRLKRTGTLEVDVRFVPWARDGNGGGESGGGEGLDFALRAEGVTEAEARLMQRSFRALPRGASPGLVDWPALTQAVVNAAGPGGPGGHRLSAGLARRRLAQVRCLVLCLSLPRRSIAHAPPRALPNTRQVCSLDCARTDTQATVWADLRGRQVIVSFRGTEQVGPGQPLSGSYLAPL